MNNTYKDKQDERKTNDWLAANGVSPVALYVGTTEVYQAIKLATNTLRDRGCALVQNQASTLNNFLRKASSTKKREKITQQQCFNIMNIAKEAQRRYAKLSKPRATVKK
jgi:hypothetical protein